MSSSPQLVLDLSTPSVPQRLSDLVCADNIRARLLALAKGDAHGRFWLRTPVKSGLTTACMALVGEATAAGQSALYLRTSSLVGQFDDIELSPLNDLERYDLLVLDEFDRLVGDWQSEEALFHFLNRCQSQHNRVVLASHLEPAQVKPLIPDLSSRLMGAERLLLAALSDGQLDQILSNAAKRLGANWEPRFSQYLLRHCARTPRALLNLQTELAKQAQAERKPLTLRFLGRVLADKADTAKPHDQAEYRGRNAELPFGVDAVDGDIDANGKIGEGEKTQPNM